MQPARRFLALLAAVGSLAVASGCGRRAPPLQRKAPQPAPAQAASILEGDHGAGPAVVLVCPVTTDLLNAKLVGLPETTIISAEIDPLQPDGKRLTERLALAEVQVQQKTYVRMTHDFFGLGAGVTEARDARQFASQRLRRSFEAASLGEKTVSGGGS